MAGLAWQLATVTAVRDETPTVRIVHARAARRGPAIDPGQHVDLRLTAEDGYSVER